MLRWGQGPSGKPEPASAILPPLPFLVCKLRLSTSLELVQVPGEHGAGSEWSLGHPFERIRLYMCVQSLIPDHESSYLFLISFSQPLRKIPFNGTVLEPQTRSDLVKAKVGGSSPAAVLGRCLCVHSLETLSCGKEISGGACLMFCLPSIWPETEPGIRGQQYLTEAQSLSLFTPGCGEEGSPGPSPNTTSEVWLSV